MVYTNLDPLNAVTNTGYKRLIYVQFSAADSYKLAIRTHENVGW